ncbi:MAG: FAD binding domain-containing protein [Oscillospiraceae bacterium]|nr:FAD binding domain-containing protein [Oscillospiraceae bacterium]
MSMFYQPLTAEEAIAYLARENTMACAGGTDLYVNRKHGKFLDKDYVSLDKLQELKQVTKKADGWHVGSMVNFACAEKLEIPGAACLAMAAAEVGAPQIRNRGTVGGNIVSASPAADSVPALMALDAKVMLRSVSGERVVPLTDFMKGPGKTDLKPGELMTEIIVPEGKGSSVFSKAGKRNALAIAVCSQAVYLETENGKITEIRVALGSVAPTAVRAYRAEALLKGTEEKALTCAEFKAALKAALLEDISPIDDVRATKEYRQTVAFRMLMHNLSVLWKEETVC